MKSQYRLVYWIGGLPVASRYKSVCGSSHLDELRREFARSYWGLKQGPKPLLRLLARLLWMPRLIMLKKTPADIASLKLVDDRLRWLSAWTIHHGDDSAT